LALEQSLEVQPESEITRSGPWHVATYRPGNEYVRFAESELITCVARHVPSPYSIPTATGLARFWQASEFSKISICTG
jgi:hypothetical protein